MNLVDCFILFLLVTLSTAKVVVELGFECPKNFPCTCETKRNENDETVNVVNCQAKGLRKVPDFTKLNMRDTISIDLSNNSLKSIPKGKFKGLRIQEVKFNNNPIKRINDRAFEEVDEVISVLCRNCSLPKVPNIFKHAEGLEILDLEMNNISKIEPGTFKDTSIRELYVGMNVFFPAEHMFIDIVETLERLSLYRSFLYSIPVNAITNLNNLKRLDLQHNFIPKITKEHMRKMPKNLTYVDLSSNPVKDIEYGALELFVNNREGVTIDFRKSKIAKVDFIEDVCRMHKVFMPLNDAPLVCDCSLYNITRDHALNTTGFCNEPEKFKWYSIYGSNSFVSNTYEVEGESCPNVWKLPCSGSSVRVLVWALVMALVAVSVLRE